MGSRQRNDGLWKIKNENGLNIKMKNVVTATLL